MTDPDWMDAAAAARVRDALQDAHRSAPAMPPDVAARLHARLAVETSAPRPAVPAEVSTLPGSRRWRPSTTTLGIAAGITAFVIAAGVITLSHRHAQPQAQSTAGGAAVSKAPDEGAATRLSSQRITHSGAQLADADALDGHVRDLVSGAGASTADTAGAPQAPGRAGPDLVATVAGGLTACLARLDEKRVPIAVDEATYLGQDSLIILYPGAGAKRVDVYVVGPACDAAPPDGLRAYRTVTVS